MDKYNISLWETFPREESSFELKSKYKFETKDRKPIYFYFQYPTLSAQDLEKYVYDAVKQKTYNQVKSTWQLHRARMKLISQTNDNNVKEFLMRCDNEQGSNSLASSGVKMVFSNEKLSPYIEDIENLDQNGERPYIIKSGEHIWLDQELYQYNTYHLNLYYRNKTYSAIKVSNLSKDSNGTPSQESLQLGSVASGLIWSIILDLQKIDANGTISNKHQTKLIAIYNIRNGQELAEAFFNPNSVSENLRWISNGTSIGSLYYAPYGLNLLDLPSNANEIFENNNQLLFTQKTFEYRVKGLVFEAGSRITDTHNYYTIIDLVEDKIYGIQDGENQIKLLNSGTYYGVYNCFDEKRKFIISCDDMRSFSRGREPSLKININGSKTFTFKMYYYYIDNETGEEVRNPYIDQIYNESRVKVYWYGEWYDFIVKNIVEDTSSMSITYTCKDLFIYDLSKNGYSIEFEDDLMNNQGDIFELANQVVQNTDWQIIDDTNTSSLDIKSDHIYQYLEEPLCWLHKCATIPNSVTIQSIDDETDITTVPGDAIAIFYSQFNKDEDKECLYPFTEEMASKDRDGLVVKNKEIKQYRIKSNISTSILNINVPWRGRRRIQSIKSAYDSRVKKNVLVYKGPGEQTYHGWTETKFKNPASVQNLFANYKEFKNTTGWFLEGAQNVNAQFELMYDPDLSFMADATIEGSSAFAKFNELLENLKTSGTLIIGETTGQTFENGSYIYKRDSNGQFLAEYQLVSSSMEQNNGNICLNLRNTSTGEVDVIEVSPNTSLTNYVGFKQNTKTYIKMPSDRRLYNKGLYENVRYLDEGLQENQIYVLRFKVDVLDGQTWKPTSGNAVHLDIASNYSEPTNQTILTYIQGSNIQDPDDPDFRYSFYKCLKSVTREEIVSNHMTFQVIGDSSTGQYPQWRISEIEFFPYYEVSKNDQIVMLKPGNIETDAIYQTYYYFYNIDAGSNPLALTREEIKFLYNSPVGEKYTFNSYESLISGLNLSPVLTYNKVTSISQKESNRFNLIQSLCEKFQCWAKFYIRHDVVSGKILTPADLGANDNVPIKYIVFKEDLTKNKGLTFTDGLDLISINKNLDSENLATQLYVKPNITEAADGGIVTIANSELNPTRDTYILNFDYFVENGMINLESLVNDQANFYIQISEVNTEYDEKEKELRKLNAELDSALALEQVYKNYVPEISDQLNENRNDIVFFINGARDLNNAVISCNNYTDALNYIFPKNLKNSKIPSKVVTLLMANLTLGNQYMETSEKLEDIQNKLSTLRARIAPLEYRIKQLLQLRVVCQKNFVQKYGQFIFEGVWESSDYIDENKYYYDAVNVASTSARPTIKYTFNVMRLGALEEYNTRQFEVGDIGYVQDSKLLGYKADGITPIKEKVVISEITYYFDESNKDKVTVQNYRTQFEDLMSRIVAQVQTPKYTPTAYDTTIRSTTITPNLPTYKI